MSKLKISCIKREYAVCPVCGSNEIVGIELEESHCGQCGVSFQMELVGSIEDNEKEEFTQISMF